MELAARPWITAAVALVGAGVVIVTPVKAVVPDIEVAAVQLTFSPEGIDPITAPSPRQTRSRRYSTAQQSCQHRRRNPQRSIPRRNYAGDLPRYSRTRPSRRHSASASQLQPWTRLAHLMIC